MAGWGLTKSILAQPLTITLLLLVSPNAWIFYMRTRRPELSRSQFTMLSSVGFFFWMTAVILNLLICSWSD